MSGHALRDRQGLQVGMIGLGRMGANLARRLVRHGHECVGYDVDPAVVEALAKEPGMTGAATFAELVAALPRPRIVWLMIPASLVDATVDELAPFLDADDIVIDGGNSYYRDDIARAARLAERGIHAIDVGTSGGVFGLERGYCLMIGGDDEPVARLDPVFRALAPGVAAAPRTSEQPTTGTAESGYLHCGPPGAGHFVKMVHNGVEYGLMAAYAEGLNILQHAGVGHTERAHDAETAPLEAAEFYRYELDVPAIAELWRRGSVVSSWLLDLTARALAADPELAAFGGRVSDSGEGRWTVITAVETGVPAPVLSAALYDRFASRGEGDFAHKVLSAMRSEFGGHRERPQP